MRRAEAQRASVRAGRLPAAAFLSLATALGLAAPFWLGAAGSVAAETEVGDLVLSGHVEVGGVILEGDNDSAKFDEYRRYRSNAVGNGFFLLENEARSHYVLGGIDFISDKDQRYELGAGRWGHYGLELEYMEFPHTFSDNALTPYNESFKGKLFLPSSSNPADDWYDELAAPGGSVGQNVDQFGESRGLKFRQINGRADAFYRPNESWEFTAGYSIQDKRGTHPGYVTFGFPNFVTIAEPLDERVHQVSGGGTYAGEGWSLGLDYRGSFFDNRLDNVTIDNPVQESDISGRSHTGRRSIAPDNSAHQVAVSGAAVFPTSFPSRLAGTFSYGIRLQDDNLLPYTSNTALAPLDQTSALPQSDLDGEIQTIQANLVYTARPTKKLNVEARYRIYDLDNKSDSITFANRVNQDQSASAASLSTFRSDFRRQNADLEASYRLIELATFQLGFGWESWKRSQDREVRHQNEYAGSVGLLFRPTDWMRFQTTYRVSARDGNQYHVLAGQDSRLRKYDEADRIRNALVGRVFLDLREDLSASLFGGFHFDDYEDTDLGLRDSNGWSAGAELDYRPASWLGLSAWYSFDSSVRKQRSTSGGDWWSRSKDYAHDVGAQADVTIVPEYLDGAVSYHFQRGDADTNASGGGGAEDYPDIDDTFHTVTTSLTYHALEKLDLSAAWTYEDFSHNNFQTDPLGTNFPSLDPDDLYLNNRVDDYDAHIIMLSARYEF